MCKSSWCKVVCNKSLGLLALRLAVGSVFLAHGLSKVNGMEGTIKFFGDLGFPAFLAYFVAWAEVLGGAALILGLFTKYVAGVLAIIMLVAIVKTKLGGEFRRAELDLVLFGANILLMTVGAGSWSLSRLCKCGCHKDNADCKVCDAIGCNDKCSQNCDSKCSDGCCGEKCEGGTCEVK